jgi:hypothetical protein
MTRFFIASIAALLLATETTSAEKMAVVEPALPPHFSGVWCYNKIASEEAIEDVAIYDRGENIPGCAIAAASLYGPTEEATHLAVLMLFVILANSKN